MDDVDAGLKLDARAGSAVPEESRTDGDKERVLHGVNATGFAYLLAQVPEAPGLAHEVDGAGQLYDPRMVAEKATVAACMRVPVAPPPGRRTQGKPPVRPSPENRRPQIPALTDSATSHRYPLRSPHVEPGRQARGNVNEKPRRCRNRCDRRYSLGDSRRG